MTNVRKLVLHKMSLDAVPPGGGIESALKFIIEPGRMAQSFKAAEEWVKAACAVVRTGTGENPWIHSDDEAIAGELLRLIEERKRKVGP